MCSSDLLAEVRMEAMEIPRGSPAAGRRLEELSLSQRHGVQVAGLQRFGSRVLNPSGQEELRVGDTLLALGTPAQIRAFREWLWENVEQGEAARAEANPPASIIGP